MHKRYDVPLRDIPLGTEFLCGNGNIWIKGALYGGHHDVWHATRFDDGHRSCFAGNVCFRIP